jgi:hypothetical protein
MMKLRFISLLWHNTAKTYNECGSKVQTFLISALDIYGHALETSTMKEKAG